MADGCDVTIYLVRKEPQQSTKKKRKLCDTHADVHLGVIYADSTRLCQCSKYFETWMTQRRSMAASSGSAQMEFWLQIESEVEVSHYHDCFARMHFPFTPFRSVAACIQVMRVAAQIQFEEVLERGVRYLAAIPWSGKDEKQIREFYSSRQLSLPCDDLCARLQVQSNEEERQNELSGLAKAVLDEYMRLALSPDSKRNTRKKSREMFTDTFQAIISGSIPSKCSKLLQYALGVVANESSSLLDSIKRSCESSTADLLQQLSNFCWLVGVAREANTAQEILQLLLNSGPISKLLQRAFRFDGFILPAQMKFAKTIYLVFQDVLNGRLLLKSSSQRLAFFDNWNWLLQEAYLEDEEVVVARVVCKFVMSFPVVEQKEIFERWVSGLDGVDSGEGGYDLSRAHGMWVECLVGRALKRVPESRREDWDNANGGWDAEEDVGGGWDSVCVGRQEIIPDARILSPVEPENHGSSSPSLNEALPRPRAGHEASPRSVARNEASPSQGVARNVSSRTCIDSRPTREQEGEEAEDDDVIQILGELY